MIEARPSRTAARVALRRAAHQLFDIPPIYVDPVAVAILGDRLRARLETPEEAATDPASRAMRAFLAARSRVAEEALAVAMSRGVRQYVVLGAGLDTFAYRNPYPAGALRVFEVDHPATQAWKRRKLAEGDIAIPSSLTFAPVDFERDSLDAGLARAGFDPRQPAFFSWLGVTMYLTREAVASTLAFVASTPRGGGIAFDYAVPREGLHPLARQAFDEIARRVEAVGEPFRSFFEPVALAAELRRIGFGVVEDVDGVELNRRYFDGRADGLRVGPGGLTHVMTASI